MEQQYQICDTCHTKWLELHKVADHAKWTTSRLEVCIYCLAQVLAALKR